MKCPACGQDDSSVKDSRPAEGGSVIRRRRACSGCGKRFTTFERVQTREMIVVKRDGRREDFDREKLERSVRIALRKRNVDSETLERTVSDIVQRLEAYNQDEITSARVGQSIMDALAVLDPVAYVRFASVYMDFQDAKDFEVFLSRLPIAKLKN